MEPLPEEGRTGQIAPPRLLARLSTIQHRLRKGVVVIAAIGSICGGLVGLITTMRFVETQVGHGDSAALLQPPPAAPHPMIPPQDPRMSLVVLPFKNSTGDPNDDHLVDGITDDLTSELSHIPQTVVIGRTTARTFKDRPASVQAIGQELGVRYILEGSVRRISGTLRVNAELLAAGSGEQVWSGRFDEPVAALADGQDTIVAGLRQALGFNLVAVEAARRKREPAASPDAFDLILQARAQDDQPGGNPRAKAEKIRLYEEALRLDPSAVLALTGLAEEFFGESSFGGWSSYEKRRRANEMLERANSIAPDSEAVLRALSLKLRYQSGGCPQAMLVSRRLLDRFPNDSLRAYANLAFCAAELGRPDEAIEYAQTGLRLNPGHPFDQYLYRRMGFAAVYAGRYEDAVTWLQQALARRPLVAIGEYSSFTHEHLAAAYASLGRMAEARRELEVSVQEWPFSTVRMHSFEDGKPETDVLLQRIQMALRLAGERDHAEEDADFGVKSDGALHDGSTGYTPVTAPGVAVIRTADLPRLIESSKPLVIDPARPFQRTVDSRCGGVACRGHGRIGHRWCAGTPG